MYFTYVPDYTRGRVPGTTGNSNNLNLFHICTRLYQRQIQRGVLEVTTGNSNDLSLFHILKLASDFSLFQIIPEAYPNEGSGDLLSLKPSFP